MAIGFRRPRRRTTLALWALLAASTIGSRSPGHAFANQGEPFTMQLRVDPFVAPVTGDATRTGVPAYLAYTAHTEIHGDPDAGVPEEPLISNTVSIPRSRWGGEGADDWWRTLGFSAGVGPFPAAADDFADEFYVWSVVPANQPISDGDDLSQLNTWFTPFDPYQVPHQPSGQSGQLAWDSRAEWASEMVSTSELHETVALPGGKVARSPQPIRFTNRMYLNHAELYADGGDVDASSGDIVLPSFEFRQPAPPGTAMAFQAVLWELKGPWGSQTELAPDLTAGQTSAPTGEWRIPISGTLHQGGFMPQRAFPPGASSPQYVVPVTAMGIPEPDYLGAGQPVAPIPQTIRMTTDLRPGSGSAE